MGALGWSAGVGARDEQRGAEAVAKLRAAGADAFVVPLDVTDDASTAAAVRQIQERAGRLDVLVNNAGSAEDWPDNPTALDLEVVRRLVDTNVIGVMRVTNAMLPLLPAGTGRLLRRHPLFGHRNVAVVSVGTSEAQRPPAG